MPNPIYEPLTLENLERVAKAVESLLKGRTYVFAGYHGGFSPESNIGFEVRVNQKMESIFLWKDDRHGGFTVHDSYGTWGATTGRAQIEISYRRDQPELAIYKKDSDGNDVVWKIKLQDKS